MLVSPTTDCQGITVTDKQHDYRSSQNKALQKTEQWHSEPSYVDENYHIPGLAGRSKFSLITELLATEVSFSFCTGR